jgi:hypothetical protein
MNDALVEPLRQLNDFSSPLRNIFGQAVPSGLEADAVGVEVFSDVLKALNGQLVDGLCHDVNASKADLEESMSLDAMGTFSRPLSVTARSDSSF